MASGIKEAGASLAFKGGLLNGNRWIGLFSAEGTEISGNDYARVSMTLSDWQADGAEYENSGVETFGPPRPGAWPALTHWGLFDAVTAGNLLFDVDMTDTDPPGVGASVTAAAEALGWSFTGAVSTNGSLAALTTGLLSGTRAISLHNAATPVVAETPDGSSGATGNAINTDGTVGAAAGKTMVAVSVAAGDWDVDSPSNTNRRARNNRVLSYGIQTADLPDPLSMAIRNGSAHNSQILWTAALTADDPGLGDALQFGVNSIVIPLTMTATV